MIDYFVLTDEALVAMYNSGDKKAFDVLFRRYRKSIDAICRCRYLIGGSVDDVKQIAYIGFEKSTKEFKNEKGSFFSFMKICVLATVNNAIEASKAKKNKWISDSVTIESLGEDHPLSSDPQEDIVNEESFKEKKERVFSVLSQREKQVFNLYLEGYSYKEIAELLVLSSKQVDNALSHTKIKAKRVISQE